MNFATTSLKFLIVCALVLAATPAAPADFALQPPGPVAGITIGPDEVVAVTPDCRQGEARMVVAGALTIAGALVVDASCLDAPDLRIEAASIHLLAGGSITSPSGRPGEAADVAGCHAHVASGGDGRRGGDILLVATAVRLEGTVGLGDGGPGGDAAAVGCPWHPVAAFGGAGGDSGQMLIHADHVEKDRMVLGGGIGGRGGDAIADGRGPPLRTSHDTVYGENGTHILSPDGGDATARTDNATQDGIDGLDAARAIARAGRAGHGAVEGGKGGDGYAFAGHGGDGLDTTYPEPRAGRGGAGGHASAFGGDAGAGPIGGTGGSGYAYSGHGGRGGDSLMDPESLRSGDGGRGGRGGYAHAAGGAGSIGVISGGAHGGDALAVAGPGGDGGSSIGIGGRGSSGGVPGGASAIGGWGWITVAGTGGSGGSAEARSGRGGDGGDGVARVGEGGPMAGARAEGGDGGFGVDGGSGGNAGAVQGSEGRKGRWMPEPARQPDLTAGPLERPSRGASMPLLAVVAVALLWAAGVRRGRPA